MDAEAIRSKRSHKGGARRENRRDGGRETCHMEQRSNRDPFKTGFSRKKNDDWGDEKRQRQMRKDASVRGKRE